jgi:hypothetical protein
MRKHEWNTLEGIAKLATRITDALERIADSLDGNVAPEVKVDEPAKIGKGKKSKKTKAKEPVLEVTPETKDPA